MISELDIFRAANLVIKRHGADAAIEAAWMVDRMLELGDLEGRDLWRLLDRIIITVIRPGAGLDYCILSMTYEEIGDNLI